MSGVYRVKKRGGILDRMSVNLTLILLNVFLFFIFTILLSTGIIQIESVAIKPSNILEGKYIWTFITSMFMHAGFFHLFANMLSLLFLGSLIERIIGPRRYLGFYILSGLFAGMLFVFASLLIPADMETFAVGASGAIFGVAGLMAILTPNLPLYVMFIPIPIKAKYAIPGLLLVLWLVSIAGNVPIGNTAHLGGLLAGIGYGIYLRTKYKNKTRVIERYFS